MKIAARFPIKTNVSLLCLLIAGHLLVLLTSIFYLKSTSAILLVLVITIFSYYYSYEQYLKVTEFNDDLCWSGENWLVHTEQNEVCYLELLDISWITQEFSLLKFTKEEQQMAWLFTRAQLGEQLYSQLCYLARLDLKQRNNDPSANN
ncbi:MAG: hypothetical protein L3J46_08065 [Kangiellaceae bacterium]|nr:hypothetical protein [Kangiellaceae bacterium]